MFSIRETQSFQVRIVVDKIYLFLFCIAHDAIGRSPGETEEMLFIKDASPFGKLVEIPLFIQKRHILADEIARAAAHGSRSELWNVDSQILAVGAQKQEAH